MGTCTHKLNRVEISSIPLNNSIIHNDINKKICKNNNKKFFYSPHRKNKIYRDSIIKNELNINTLKDINNKIQNNNNVNYLSNLPKKETNNTLNNNFIQNKSNKINALINTSDYFNKFFFERKEKAFTFVLKDRLRCFFCGGKSCKHENYKKQSSTSAIKGLNSDLIDKCVYASQRPSTILINKFNLIQEFKKTYNIELVVNLQREGEHPYCGPNQRLEDSGYTYFPQAFINEGINVYHSGWKDMGVPDSVSFVLNIVKNMYNTIVKKKKRVLVHCHAGYGRTGIIIACFLIYYHKYTTEEAVKYLRSYRSKCIEKNAQYKFCKMFEDCKIFYIIL